MVGGGVKIGVSEGIRVGVVRHSCHPEIPKGSNDLLTS